MDKESITQYAWIIIIAIVMASLMVFATPFGDTLSESFVALIKGQSEELDTAYSEKNIEENRNYMEQLFDATHMQQGGLYKHNDSSVCIYTWEQLQSKNLIVIENGIISAVNEKEKIAGDLIIDDAITKINGATFSGCENIVLIRMGFGTTNVANGAFRNCANLETFISGINLREISSLAFRDCINLKNVYLNEKVNNIGINAFTNCPLLETIYYDGTMEQWDSITKGDGALGTTKQIVCSDGTIEL